MPVPQKALPYREASIATRIYRFYLLMAVSVWTLWYAFAGLQPLAILEANWPITLTMVFGSIIAGATSEGGGAVAFPIFTKALAIAPSDAKVFSLAIQSVGALVLLILSCLNYWMYRSKRYDTFRQGAIANE